MEVTLNLEWLTYPWVWGPFLGVVWVLLSPVGYFVIKKLNGGGSMSNSDPMDRFMNGLVSLSWPLVLALVVVVYGLYGPFLLVGKYARWVNRDKE